MRCRASPEGVERRVARLAEQLVVLRLTKWQRVALPMIWRLSRTVPAIQLRADAPTWR